jgi:hypothetical protein
MPARINDESSLAGGGSRSSSGDSCSYPRSVPSVATVRRSEPNGGARASARSSTTSSSTGDRLALAPELTHGHRSGWRQGIRPLRTPQLRDTRDDRLRRTSRHGVSMGRASRHRSHSCRDRARGYGRSADLCSAELPSCANTARGAHGKPEALFGDATSTGIPR